MAGFEIRYLVKRAGARGGLPRYFWQPSTKLRGRGFISRRVPADWSTISDPLQLRIKAIAEAEELNAWLDAKREAEPTNPARLPPAVHTVETLITLYRASPAFLKTAPATRRVYDQCLRRIDAWAGNAPVGAIDYRRIEKLSTAMANTPSFRNAVLRVLSILLEHGLRIGWLHRNPARQVGLAKKQPPSGLIWPRAAIAALVSTADAQGRHSIGTAVMLNEWLGQRQGDLLQAKACGDRRWQHLHPAIEDGRPCRAADRFGASPSPAT